MDWRRVYFVEVVERVSTYSLVKKRIKLNVKNNTNQPISKNTQSYSNEH